MCLGQHIGINRSFDAFIGRPLCKLSPFFLKNIFRSMCAEPGSSSDSTKKGKRERYAESDRFDENYFIV